MFLTGLGDVAVGFAVIFARRFWKGTKMQENQFVPRSRAVIALVLAASISGCAQNSQEMNQTLGALGGAAVGAAIGQAFGSGSGRVAATLVGSVVGGLVGSAIAQSLSETDRTALGQASEDALRDMPDGQSRVWKAPESGKDITITTSNTRTDQRPLKMARITQVEAPGAGFEVLGQPYRATANLRLRATPTVDANNVIGGFQAGDRIQIAGRTATGNWYLVSRNDVAVGYVHGDYVTPLETHESATFAEAKPEMTGGVDLDAAPRTETVVQSKVTCRDISYELEAEGEDVESCKAPDGAWKLG